MNFIEQIFRRIAGALMRVVLSVGSRRIPVWVGRMSASEYPFSVVKDLDLRYRLQNVYFTRRKWPTLSCRDVESPQRTGLRSII